MGSAGAAYSIQEEANRIFHNVLLADKRLDVPAPLRDAAARTSFVGELTKPFVPTPCKLSESSSALWALVATYANAIIEDRYQLVQNVKIDTDIATLYTCSAALATLDGQALNDRGVVSRLARFDKYHNFDIYRRMVTNIYRTRDKRFFHTHGSLNPSPTLKMLGLPDRHPDLDIDQVIKILNDRVQELDSAWLDRTANEEFRQAGTICYTPEEFANTAQGKAMDTEPLFQVTQVQPSLPATTWPATQSTSAGALQGIKVLDLSRILAAPSIAKNLAALGATVIRISIDTNPDFGMLLIDCNLGKRDVNLDLKTAEGKAALQRLLEEADVLLDGYRPGALERLGFGREALHRIAEKRGKGIVHIRENCYGWKGPLADRSGWQQISDCVTGVSWLQGRFQGLDEPVVPPLPNSDYQTGIAGAAAVLDALYRRSKNGGSYDIDVSLNQFNIWYLRLGELSPEQQHDLRQLHPGFSPRHYDDMTILTGKLLRTLHQHCPAIFAGEHKYGTAPSKWGVEGETIRFLVPCLRFDKSEVGWSSGSCEPGGYPPEWPRA